MSNKQGALFLIGGAAESCMPAFVKEAGGVDSHIVIITHASSIPREVGNSVTEQLRKAGARRITVITPRSRVQSLPADVDAIFISGGDQMRLVRALDRNGLAEQVRDAYRRGVLIAGTSAGAAAAPLVMVAGGMQDKERKLQRDSLQLGKGLCLLPGVVVDTHFAQRNRHNRLRAALATLDGVTGIGLDEDTAVVITADGTCRVVGAAAVWVLRRTETQETSWEARAESVSRSKYTAGDSFELLR